MTDSNYVISDTIEDLERPHKVTLTEAQISTILYCMEGYISGQAQEELDEQFDKDCEAVFEELEGTLDRFYNKEEVPQWDETKEDAQENNVKYSPLNEDSDYANKVDSLVDSMKESGK